MQEKDTDRLRQFILIGASQDIITSHLRRRAR